MQINIEVFYKFMLSLWMCIIKYAQSTQNKKFAYLCNFPRQLWRTKFIFCLQIPLEVFYKLIISFWLCIVSHARSTLNDKFAISLQCLKENVKAEIYFFPANKDQRLLQIDTIVLSLCSQACPNYTE